MVKNCTLSQVIMATELQICSADKCKSDDEFEVKDWTIARQAGRRHGSLATNIMRHRCFHVYMHWPLAYLSI